jgi:hypothetical protein
MQITQDQFLAEKKNVGKLLATVGLGMNGHSAISYFLWGPNR